MSAILFSHQCVDHYSDVIMRAIASQITCVSIVCSTVFAGADQRKHQSSATQAFVRGIRRWPVNCRLMWISIQSHWQPSLTLFLVPLWIPSNFAIWHILIITIIKENMSNVLPHDDVIKWKHFQRYWPFVRGIHRSPVNSPHKGQWRGTLMFSLICAWIKGWVINCGAGKLRRYRAHYDVTVMYYLQKSLIVHTYQSSSILTAPPTQSVTSAYKNPWM